MNVIKYWLLILVTFFFLFKRLPTIRMLSVMVQLPTLHILNYLGIATAWRGNAWPDLWKNITLQTQLERLNNLQVGKLIFLYRFSYFYLFVVFFRTLVYFGIDRNEKEIHLKSRPIAFQNYILSLSVDTRLHRMTSPKKGIHKWK